MLLDAVVSDLKTIYGVYLREPLAPDAPHFTDEDLERWTALAGTTRVILSEQIAIYLAERFHTSELTFGFCDAIVNDLFGILTSPPAGWSETFYRIYCAFDEGEYQHQNRPPDEDPVDVYTRPYIAQILADLRMSN
jgi:hypothetical protein